jgi:hypothetical protein
VTAPSTYFVPTSGYVKVLPMVMSAGSYLVTFTLDLAGGASNAGLGCQTYYTLAPNVKIGSYANVSVPASQYQSTTLQDVVTVADGNEVSVHCYTNSGNTAGDSYVYYGTVTALKMGTVSPSGFTTLR